jgi:hypothetical protein
VSTGLPMPNQKGWQALFRAAEAAGLEIVEVAAGDVRVTLRLKGQAAAGFSHVERFQRKSARTPARKEGAE